MPGSKHRVWGRVGVLVAMAAAFGVLGWLAGPPRTTKAALQNEQRLVETKHQLDEAAQAKAKLQQQLRETSNKVDELADQLNSTQQLQEVQQKALDDYKARADRAAQELTAAQAAKEPLARQIELAQQAAQQVREQAAATGKMAEELNAKLTQVDSEKSQIAQDLETARQEKLRLAEELSQQKRSSEQANALLDCLDVRKGQVRLSKKHNPADPPVTAKELIAALGAPAITSEKDRVVRMEWSQHVADVRGGMVESLDGRPCSRQMMLEAGSHLPQALAPAEPYRLQKGESVSYSDMVSLFGKPEAIEGTGRNFNASWAVGAWARNAVAVVSDGIVTKFDGKDADPEEICQLVRQRANAYPNKAEATKRLSTSAQEFYTEAKKHLGQEVLRDISVQRHDGLTLKSWSIGEFNSVNTWIAPTTFAPDAMTMRTTLTCTWEASGGKTSTTRQYAVVTLAPQNGQYVPVECSIFQGCD